MPEYKLMVEVRQHMLDPGRPAESKRSFSSPHWAVLWAITNLGWDYGRAGFLWWLVVDAEGMPAKLPATLN